MLVGHQRIDAPWVGAERVQWTVSGAGFWVHVVRQVGLGADENLAPGLGYGRPRETRNVIGLTLSGAHRLRYGDGHTQVVRPGGVLQFPGRSAFRASIAAGETCALSINIETDRRLHGGAWHTSTVSSVDARANSAIRLLTETLTSSIERAWEAPEAEGLVAVALRALVDRLRALGILTLDDAAITTTPPRCHEASRLRAVSHAVDLALSRSDARAMLVDLESLAQVSARTIQRVFPRLCEAWGQASESFKAHCRRVTLARACALMTHPEATTESVARLVGFASPNAFCRAMAARGLPSPGNVRARMRALA
jgi:hypothetical protein